VIFMLNLPIVAAALGLALTKLTGRQTRREGVRVELLGGLLCAVGLGGIVLGFIEQPRRGPSSAVALPSGRPASSHSCCGSCGCGSRCCP
jgi:hypothetical protein